MYSPHTATTYFMLQTKAYKIDIHMVGPKLGIMFLMGVHQIMKGGSNKVKACVSRILRWNCKHYC